MPNTNLCMNALTINSPTDITYKDMESYAIVRLFILSCAKIQLNENGCIIILNHYY